MAYKNDVTPQKGDAVLGALNGAPARGTVLSYDDKKDTILIQRRGAAESVARPGGKNVDKVKGGLEQHAAPASDFELVYRKGA